MSRVLHWRGGRSRLSSKVERRVLAAVDGAADAALPLREAVRYDSFVPDPDRALLTALRNALASGPPVKLAVLFGSRARGTPHTPRSDVDVGIVPYDSSLTLADELALASALSGAVDLEVDLVRLDRGQPLLDREVALRGVCIHEAQPGVFAAWRAEALARFLDFEETIAPHRDRFLRRLARGRT